MTVLLAQAIASLRDLPEETQDTLARMLLEFAEGDRAVIELTEEEAASFDEICFCDIPRRKGDQQATPPADDRASLS